jgi:hypothetical protein
VAFKPNYRLQRAERTRAKQARAEEKLREKQARAAVKPGEPDDAPPPPDGQETE